MRRALYGLLSNGPARSLAGALRRRLPDAPVTRRLPTIGRFTFGLRCQPWLLGDGCFDGHRGHLAWFKRLVRPGETFWDVGANIGYYARFVLHHCDPAKLVAVEPMEQNLRRLRRNLGPLAGDRASRVALLELAAADAAGSANFRVDDFAGGTGAVEGQSERAETIGMGARGGRVQTQRVELARIDELVAARGLPAPDAMKIDVEGAEGSVLAGMKGLFDAGRRPRFMIATHGVSKVRDVLDALLPLGYACYGETDDAPWRKLQSGDAERLKDNNLVASVNETDVANRVEPLDLAAHPAP